MAGCGDQVGDGQAAVGEPCGAPRRPDNVHEFGRGRFLPASSIQANAMAS